jgi:toxin ParE1/3/4
MVLEVTFRPEAEADLFEIYSYIADKAGLRIAGDYVARIEAACFSLATFPERGALRNDLAPGVRVLIFERRATIAYRVEGDRVRIARVFYAGRDYGGDDFGE